MNSAVNKEKAKVFEAILSSPGMSEKCKINIQISRQQVLLLGRLIEAGLLNPAKVFQDEIIQAFPAESLEDFKVIHEEIMRKAGLTEFYERIKSL